MKDNKQRLFEIMGKVNPDFVIKEAGVISPPPMPPPASPELQQKIAAERAAYAAQGIVDDGEVSIGELKTAIKLMMRTKDKPSALQMAKEKFGENSDVYKLVVGLAGAATIFTGGGAVVVGIGILGAAVTAGEAFNFFKKMFNKESTNGIHTQNPFMEKLKIDPEVSTILDKNIENEFVQYAADTIMQMSDTAPMPDFFEKLKQFLKDKNYAQKYTIANTQAPTAR